MPNKATLAIFTTRLATKTNTIVENLGSRATKLTSLTSIQAYPTAVTAAATAEPSAGSTTEIPGTKA